MTLTKEKAKENLSRLITKFERELAAGKISEYNEEAAKIAFIQPLLKDVLGWDVNDHDEVGPEERTSRGRVDYGLKVEGKIKIFVEAKPPKVDLDRHIEQAIRYGYNRRGVPFVLLTDFEALKLFDVTVKPDSRNPLKGLKLDLEWKQYLDQFDWIWQLSRESVAAGKLDELLRVKPKDRLPVDKAILEDLKRWREILAKDIFKNNQELFHSGDHEKGANYLKEITQKILDRIIFMRSCEDRGLYHGDKLKAIFEERSETVGTNTMVFLKKEFESYNIFFDSDLFSPREWEAKLAVDFKVIKEIVLGTYNPYQFDVIPLEVLGNIYEQYLGYTIRLTDHQVKYELKPEVRKAGGVYYTPEYIVDYIVKNTAGKLLQESPPSKNKKLRILDPACGSGSFLIRAYEEMLNYYQEQKTKRVKPREGEKKLALPDEKLRLTIYEKRDILINHIFGVDIDEQAVEVTKLSLMLKMLDGEHGIPAGRGILPMLDKNIKCGNSLISGNPLELHRYFGEDWYKVKPFNWEDEFPHIMKEEGGFDVVIGNPPWGATFSESELDYLRMEHKDIVVRMIDSYMYFVHSASNILSRRAFFGMILPSTLLTQADASKLRKYLIDSYFINAVINLGEKVFGPKVLNTSTILIFSCGLTGNLSLKLIVGDLRHVPVSDKPKELGILPGISRKDWYSVVKSSPSYAFTTISLTGMNILQKLTKRHTRFKEVLNGEIQRGISPDLAEAFLIDRDTRRSEQLEDSVLRPVVLGKHICRYMPIISDLSIIYLTRNDDIRNYPNIRKHLESYKGEITCKEVSTGKHPWYALHRPRSPEIFNSPKFIGLTTTKLISVAYDEAGSFCATDALYLFKIKKELQISPYYILGVLHSLCFQFLYTTQSQGEQRVIPQIKAAKLYDLPFVIPNIGNIEQKLMHDKIVSNVNILFNLSLKNVKAKGSEKDQIQRQIENTDREIDDLVYKLYGITEEERRIIEGELK